MTLDDLDELLLDFEQVASRSGLNVPAGLLQLERLPAPHKRPSVLPAGKCAVYGFLFRGRCLKVGKVGPRSAPRFCAQHYIPGSSGSNLAKSVLGNREKIGSLLTENELIAVQQLDESTVGTWLESGCARFHILCPVEMNGPPLSLLEAFAQCRLDPLFEPVNPTIRLASVWTSAIASNQPAEGTDHAKVYLAIAEMRRGSAVLTEKEQEWVENFAVVLDRLQSGGGLSDRQVEVALDIYARFKERLP